MPPAFVVVDADVWWVDLGEKRIRPSWASYSSLPFPLLVKREARTRGATSTEQVADDEAHSFEKRGERRPCL